VHHMPAGPPPTSRIAAALRRVLPVFAVVLAVAGIAFAVPVVSTVVTSSSEQAALEATAAARQASSGAGESGGSSSARSTSGGGTVQMGVDGAPATETPAETPATETPETPAADQPETAPAAPADASTPSSSAPAAKPAPQESRDEPAAAEAPTPAPAPAPAPAPRAAPAAPAAPGIEGQVLTLVNQARATAGCAPLVADSALAAVARAHSADMRDRDYFDHDTPEGLSPFDRAEQAGISYARAENIAYGQANPTEVMDDWMTSPGHRDNILDCELTKLGVGVAEGPRGPWWTQLFGA
jgi:uncharacterized protein YkwD